MTKQDLEQIRRYFLEKGIRDTDLKKANALDGTEIWGVVQGGKSVKISMKDILVFLKPLMDENDGLFCGFHTSEENLKGLYPTAKEGAYAWVITEEFPDYPGEVYTYSLLHGWVATGVKASDSSKVELDDYIKSQEVDEISKLPDYTASRAIMDGSGNIIEDTYVRRDELMDGAIKGDSYLPEFNTSVFLITKEQVQYPGFLRSTIRAISGTGYVRDTLAMFEVYGLNEASQETLIQASTELQNSLMFDISVSKYKLIRVKIFQDLKKSILLYTQDIPVVRDGIDGKNGKDGIDGTNGSNGTDGTNGTDGQTPYIGSNGNWWIGNKDLGILAEGVDGAPGKDGETPTIEISDNDTWIINGVDTKRSASYTPHLLACRMYNNQNMSYPPTIHGYKNSKYLRTVSVSRYNDMIRISLYPSSSITVSDLYYKVVRNVVTTTYPLMDYRYTTSVITGITEERDFVSIVIGLFDFNGNANYHEERSDIMIYIPSVDNLDYF